MDLQKLRLLCKIATEFSRCLIDPYLEVSLHFYSGAIKHMELMIIY